MSTSKPETATPESAGALIGKPRATTAKSRQKRKDIIRAATDALNRRGYGQATMCEIAASLGLRDGTLYYYYPSKTALAFACYLASLERIERLIEEAEAGKGSGAEKLRRYIRLLLIDGDVHGSQLYFGDYSYLDDPERAKVRTWVIRLEARIENFLIEGVRDQSIVPCDTGLVSQLLIGMLISLARWTWRIEDVTVDRLMEAIGIASLNGLQRSTD